MKRAFFIPFFFMMLVSLMVGISDPDGDGKMRLDTVLIGGTVTGAILGLLGMLVVSIWQGYKGKAND